MAPNTDNMLPNTPGPKLGEFKNGKHTPVKFMKKGGLGSGAHSHVWKVKISNRIYALKMFRHIKAEEDNTATPERLAEFNLTSQLLNDQLTPFNCEARAYGRLKETGNEKIAWKCEGYIILDEETYGWDVWNTIKLPREDWFSPVATAETIANTPVFPIYALVKEFIPDAAKRGALDVKKAHDIAQGLNTLHSIGITHRDVQDRNYVDSRIIDFSTSWTVPNIRLDRKLKWDTEDDITQQDAVDYFMFDAMIEQWNIDHPNEEPSSYRMTTGEKYRKKQPKPGKAGKAKKRKSSAGSSSSTSSDASLEEIPRLERMVDNKYLVLPSTYNWVERKSAVSQAAILKAQAEGVEPQGEAIPAAPEPEANPAASEPEANPAEPEPGSNDGGDAAAVTATTLTPEQRFQVPDVANPKFTMMWSWSATPGAAAAAPSNVPADTPSAPAPLSSSDAKKLEEIKRALGIVRNLARQATTNANATVTLADKILAIIGSDSAPGDDGGDDAAAAAATATAAASSTEQSKGKKNKRPRHH